MPFNVETFRNNVFNNKGFLRSNRFEVIITPPEIMRGRTIVSSSGQASVIGINDQMKFYAHEATLPGFTLGVSEVRRDGYGLAEKKPFVGAFTEVGIRFYADANSLVWNYLQLWLTGIFNFIPTSGGTLSSVSYNDRQELTYKKDYTASISINVYDIAGKKSITVELIDAFPLSISDLPLNWGDNNSLMRVSTVFSFKTWTSTGSNALTPEQAAEQGRLNIRAPVSTTKF
jgi:hypothetical protein